jgi:hypothetical protein
MTSWVGGQLDEYKTGGGQLIVRMMPARGAPHDASVIGDRPLASDAPAVQQLEATVQDLVVESR